MLKAFVQRKTYCFTFKNPFPEQNFRHAWYKLLKMLGQIFVKKINLGNFAAVKIFEGTRLSSHKNFTVGLKVQGRFIF